MRCRRWQRSRWRHGDRSALPVFLLAFQRRLSRAHRPEPQGPGRTRSRPVHLLRDGGEQHSAELPRRQPAASWCRCSQHGQRMLRQSLAILEYLDEMWPDAAAAAGHRARPRSACARWRSWSPATSIRSTTCACCSISSATGACRRPSATSGSRHWIVEGFDAFEALLPDHPSTGAFCDGDVPTIADCCLVPQVYNARRFGDRPGAVPEHRCGSSGLPGACRRSTRRARNGQPDAPEA